MEGGSEGRRNGEVNNRDIGDLLAYYLNHLSMSQLTQPGFVRSIPAFPIHYAIALNTVLLWPALV